MSHITTKSGYTEFVDRLNRFPQGAPPSETLYKILEVLVSEREAQVLAQLPIRPFTAPQAARLLRMSVAETRDVLDGLADRAVLVDTERDGETTYTLPPPMAGFFEFSMMRMRGDVDQKLLGELFYQYMNIEEEFIKNLFVRGETQIGRVFVHEPVLSRENALHVLDYERATEVVTSATHRGIGVCYCRHKMMHVGRNCDAPMEICMTFNGAASSLIRHGYAREVDVAEGLDLLQQAYEQNLVQFGENVRERVNFICNCCACCCEAMIAARDFGMLNPVHTSNFMPTVDETACSGCGRCVDVCPVGAIGLVSANDPHDSRSRIARVDEEICLGCGVCVRTCSRTALSLRSRPARVITPLNSTHRVIVMAIERGNLQDLVFDKRVLWNHRALAALLGVVLRLPPAKQVLASRQMKSRYLEYLIARFAP
ncbi:4Fe-4S dicluster domain-containing protein [Anaerosoma tenue]|uniref:4Fe-4S dicluster domain-containing protein n=1 Tax=Anaerosoma tenue TaxID=2933588 RepID=UPI002260BA7A|nr:4Fe-4S dicluster domain-containing protein [Anaerosoma tenue]MCK8115344.1 4Fe-4S dicluster domain-containing protein [Anaerosoma tenue]